MAKIPEPDHQGVEERSHVSTTHIRTLFSKSLSSIYKSEVALYTDLVNVVNKVNSEILDQNEALRQALELKNDLRRLGLERHGAIRLGSADELRMMARFLKVMGMVSVGYYDLTQAGLPIHATCFRTTNMEELAENPLRLFVSLLRPEYVKEDLRPFVLEVLSRRRIFSQRVEELVGVCETHGGLTMEEAMELISEGIQTFRWRGDATVTEAEYQSLLQENPIVADIVGFHGPHINHLTPRALDIDMVQKNMHKAGLPAKNSIEGPPRRACPILLRQTSYYAQREAITFPSESATSAQPKTGFHKARFGEIEERGAALTPKGRKLYDTLLEGALAGGISTAQGDVYAQHFSKFPDDWQELRQQGLVWTRYVVNKPDESKGSNPDPHSALEDLVQAGVIRCEPIVYEDFLPISAAGIFQSNLKDSGRRDSILPTKMSVAEDGGRAVLAQAVGGTIRDEMDLYREMQAESLEAVWKELCLAQPIRLY